MADVVVVDVAWPRAHVPAAEQLLYEAVDVDLDPLTESVLVVLAEGCSRRWLQQSAEVIK